MKQQKINFAWGKAGAVPAPICDYCSREAAQIAYEFHRTLPGYRPTSLHSLSGLARLAGVKTVLLKDESERFGLNAFKVLGASFAMARLLGQYFKMGATTPDFKTLLNKAASGENLTFVTATDGNHGRAVAWAAQQVQQRAVVYVPRNTAPSRMAAIRDHGAEVIEVDANYDEAVEIASQQAHSQGWFLVQDTAAANYEQIPRDIMQGYTTLAYEARQQLQALDLFPTHIFLQAGVGSFAASQLSFWMSLQEGEEAPQFVIMEPDKAACFHLSASQGDGHAHSVGGDLSTIMAGLSCGVPNPLAWPLLRDHASLFVTCPDYVSAYGMRILGNPLAGDRRVEAGESGAVGAGLLALMTQQQSVVDRLNLTKDSVVLLINTEGATDPVQYEAICWAGSYPVQ